jgi:hypothetical protein
MAKAVRRTVQVRAYADRIVVRCDGEIVADHPRCFGRDRTIYDPWHYLPVLVTKPGALRNGAPFQDWELPPALARLRQVSQRLKLPRKKRFASAQSLLCGQSAHICNRPSVKWPQQRPAV